MALWSSLETGQVTPANRRGKGQGYFRYYNSDGTYQAIVAVGGKLIRNGGDLAITGLPNGFQTDRMIEAVQYGDKMYIATGSGLVVYDGATAQLVTPYTPMPLEALYVGVNALAANPDTYLADGVSGSISLAGVTVDKRKGVVNQISTFNAYVNKPAGVNLKYSFQYKLKSADTFLPTTISWQDSKTWTFKPDKADEYEIKVMVKDSTVPGDTPADTYILPSYKVTAYDENVTANVSGINTCNRILLHWDRLILYGDTVNKNTVYISHLKKPDYFPTTNTLIFESDTQEPVTKIVQFRDFLVAFLPSSIQALYGKSPLDYRRVKLHTGIGCVAPESACVMGNVIAFLSKEGVYVLKSFGLAEDRMNVERIDTKIANLIPAYPDSADACSIYHEDQLHICFPKIKTRFRFYRTSGAWTKDESIYFDFCRFHEIKGDLVVQSQSTGEVYQFDDSIYQDLDYVYEDKVETKPYDFGVPYNPKKLRELQVIIGHEGYDPNISAELFGDGAALLSTYKATPYVDEEGFVQVKEEYVPNITSESGTAFGEWDLGIDGFGEVSSSIHKLRLKSGHKHRTAKVILRHKEAKPYTLIGLGFVFKLKKP